MEQPKVLGTNIIACAANRDAVFAALAAGGKGPAMIIAAGICNAPLVAGAMAAGWAG